LRTSTEALPAEAAQQFTRLLSSICNPTVSAARQSSKRGRNELNDETKKARLFAGQQMQYLIMEYARSTLDGQINPLVKEHLMPGLYAVLDAMDRDLMRALNSGMDPSSRAIFKTLYDDWCRYGRWDKS
jgi:nucleolar pre-ribosomal-associated protein 2